MYLYCYMYTYYMYIHRKDEAGKADMQPYGAS